MVSISMKDLEASTWEYVETLRDSPKARLKSREKYYLTYCKNSKGHKYGLGDSEISFFKWEERGVLHPIEAKPPGSQWWSNVNLWFIFLSEFGARAVTAGLMKKLPPGPPKFWAEFIVDQQPKSWYKAHNSSIIEGYLKYSDMAELESIPEKVFLNQVLCRLLFAQYMVEGNFFFPRIGEFLANPQGISVRLITHLDGFYPKHYPMTKKEIEEVMGESNHFQGRLVKFLDRTIILPKILKIYTLASEINSQPLLLKFLINNKPSYPEGIPKSK
jgi:hypothetical protein